MPSSSSSLMPARNQQVGRCACLRAMVLRKEDRVGRHLKTRSLIPSVPFGPGHRVVGRTNCLAGTVRRQTGVSATPWGLGRRNALEHVAGQQIAQGDSERVSEQPHVVDRNVPHAALDFGDVSATEACLQCQRFLRYLFEAPGLAKVAREDETRRGRDGCFAHVASINAERVDGYAL